MGAIFVMWKRQLLRFWRSKPRIFVSMFQPVLFLVAFGFGFGSTYEAANGSNYINFLAPGIVAMTILFGSVMNGIETIWDKQFGFLKETLVAPVSRTNIMLGRSLGGATIAMIQGVLVLLITTLFGFRIVSFTSLLMALIIMFLISMIFTSIGIAIASKIDDMQSFPILMNFFIMPTFFLSGALFSINNLPEILRFFVQFNPMVYGVDALRGLLSGVFEIGLIFDLFVLVPLAIIMILIGAYFFKRIEV